MSDPFVEVLRGGINSFGEVISLADDLDGVAKQVSDLGKKELAARQAWRRKQAIISGDYGYVDAVEEWRRVKEAKEAREQVRRDVIKRWGAAAWDEILAIEQRQKEDFAKIYTEDGHDRKKLFQVKLACFGAAFIITMILWATGVVHDMAIAFYGE